MANPTGKGGKRFPPGVSGNPNGRPKVDRELREMKQLNEKMFERAVDRLSRMTQDELIAYLKNGDEEGNMPTNLEVMVAGQIIAAAKGKTTPLAFLMNRRVGPVKQIVEVFGNDDAPIKVDHKITDLELDDETFAALAALAAKRKPS